MWEDLGSKRFKGNIAQVIETRESRLKLSPKTPPIHTPASNFSLVDAVIEVKGTCGTAAPR